VTTQQPLQLRTRLAVRAGRSAARLSRLLGRGEGSVIGGRVTLAIDPLSLPRLAAQRTVLLVSGTNGKTTTTSLVVAALRSAGDVATNAAGANMFGGMVSALSGASAATAVLETDEAHLGRTLEDTRAAALVLLNLSRDQLDRVGEVRMQAKRWRDAIEAHHPVVIANADDPMVVWAAEAATSPVWVAGGGNWKLDAASCPACGAKVRWDQEDWACTGCALRRPEPVAYEVPGSDVVALPGGAHVPLHMQLPGDINRKNGLIALAAAVRFGADPARAAAAVGAVEGAGGRFAVVRIGTTSCRLLLAKNPAGWTEALRIARPGAAAVVIGINARVQDGRDPSWLWDVPFERLQGTFVVATGDRGRDLAVRLRYAGVEHAFVADRRAAVREAAVRAPREEIDVMGNYSAFQDFRKVAR